MFAVLRAVPGAILDEYLKLVCPDMGVKIGSFW